MLQAFITTVVFAASSCQFSSQQVCDERNSIKDVSAFVGLFIASEKHCPGIKINAKDALSQAGDLALYISKDSATAENLVNSIGKALSDYSEEKPNEFCEDARKTLDSYSPEYLEWYGIAK